MLGEVEDRWGDRQGFLAAGHGGDALAFADRVGEILAAMFDEVRLRVE